jgi:hypothetical protein
MTLSNISLLFFKQSRHGHPMALVQVTRSQGNDYAGQHHDMLISCECLNPTEFDAEIDRLHRELETVRREAKKRFSKAV